MDTNMSDIFSQLATLSNDPAKNAEAIAKLYAQIAAQRAKEMDVDMMRFNAQYHEKSGTYLTAEKAAKFEAYQKRQAAEESNPSLKKPGLDPYLQELFAENLSGNVLYHVEQVKKLIDGQCPAGHAEFEKLLSNTKLPLYSAALIVGSKDLVGGGADQNHFFSFAVEEINGVKQVTFLNSHGQKVPAAYEQAVKRALPDAKIMYVGANLDRVEASKAATTPLFRFQKPDDGYNCGPLTVSAVNLLKQSNGNLEALSPLANVNTEELRSNNMATLKNHVQEMAKIEAKDAVKNVGAKISTNVAENESKTKADQLQAQRNTPKARF
jgi:hypothetical protein